MSKLHLLAHRCPVMGKALAVQSARLRVSHGGERVRAHTTKAALHTASVQEAAAVDVSAFSQQQSLAGRRRAITTPPN